MNRIVGWDIGGANVKAACVTPEQGAAEPVPFVSQQFEIWREKDRLPEVLRSVYSRIVLDQPPRAAAISMTAELSDVFATKREGVLFVLESLQASFPEMPSYVLNIAGEFVIIREAQSRPLDFAATNWLASALWFAGQFPNCLLVDVGSTTTDVLPILDGKVRVLGRTDLERLSSGELIFTGALRTNLAAIVQSLPIAGQECRVASEYFAISGDIHLILGNIHSGDYECSTPDGQPPSVDSARKRLARLVCADTEMLTAADIDAMAGYIQAQQVRQVSHGIEQVLARLPHLRKCPVIAVGSGAFLGVAAARGLNLDVLDLARERNGKEYAVAPCVAAAHLLARRLTVGVL